MPSPVVTSRLSGIPLLRRGKVRDIYRLPEGLLIVATDRLSAFDVVLTEGIPGKGIVLTALSEFWFEAFSDLVENHLLTADVREMPEAVRRHEATLAGRTMLVREARVLPLECIARGYLAGSAYREYRDTGSICGITPPPGLTISSRLPEPLFTPSTKAKEGHDENVTLDRAREIVGEEMAARIEETTLALYRRGAEILEEKGILLCDTKLEFGVDGDGSFLLVDEVLTPDSSRFWDRETWEPGRVQDSYDKQIVREYLMTLDWDRRPPPPPLPPPIVEKTAARYAEIAERILGRRPEVLS